MQRKERSSLIPYETRLTLRHSLVNLRVARRVYQMEQSWSCEAQTVPVPVITKKLAPVTSFLPSPLPRDKQGRAYLCRTDPLIETSQLIQWAVEDFYQAMHRYPAVIYLNRSRWAWGRVLGSYSVCGKDIRLAECDEQCEVCCKSGPLLE